MFIIMTAVPLQRVHDSRTLITRQSF